jgi:hypothetical protein
MFQTYLFWLFLLFPGYALCRWQRLDDLKYGFLGVCATSYLASFFLLSPISILAYWIELPLWFISLGYLVLVVGAIVVIVLKGWWRELFKYSSDSPVADAVAILVLGVYLYGSMMSGPFLTGDAWFHIARIRFLVVNGVSNADPFIGKGFSPWYHTNVYHALLASGVQLTRLDVFDFWYHTLPWAKLMLASGFYYFAFVIFRNKWIAWIAALTYLGSKIYIDYNLYPNQLAPLWLLPVGLGFAVSCFSEDRDWKDLAKLAICSFIIGQVHALYSLFFWYAVAGCAVALLTYRIMRKQPGKYRLIQCIIAVSVVIPFPAITKYKIVEAKSAKAQIMKPDFANQIAKEEREPEKQELGDHKDGDVEIVSDKMFQREAELDRIKSIAIGAFGSITDKLLLLVAIILGLISKRRKHFGILLLITAELYVVTLIPILRELMLDMFGKAWIIKRMLMTANACQHVILVGGWLICLVDFATHRYVKTIALPSLIVLSSLVAISGDVLVLDYSMWFEKLNAGFLSEDGKKTIFLNKVKLFRKVLLEHIPEGSVVLANNRLGYHMAASFNAKLVYTNRNVGLISDVARRKKDSWYLLSKDTDQNLRRRLFQRYGVKYWVYVAATKEARDKNAWTSEYGKVVSEQYGIFILQIK